MKTNELDGMLLDWAVTTIEEPEALRFGVADWREQRRSRVVAREYVHRYHQSWAQGGPIIEREGISTTHCNGGWEATLRGHIAFGTTALIAAMRCYVASKLGDEVEVPEELK